METNAWERFSAERQILHYPYPTMRQVVMGTRGAVATSQPLATFAGIQMLLAGGNAIDAAIATAIALTVVEPTSNGIGSDAFALVWDGKLHGLNASGRSPRHIPVETLLNAPRMPDLGWKTVTVPGAVSAWRSLSERWGKLPFEKLFEPAIEYAEAGFPVSPETARAWQRAEQIFTPLSGAEYQPFQAVFFPNGRAPRAGEIWSSPNHAKTLRSIAQSQGESFYRGELADAIAQFAEQTGGWIDRTDLATHQADWVTPISTNYRGVDVWEIPPNTHGIATLMALNILEGFDLTQFPRDSVESFHLQIEAMKLAFADVDRHVSDPASMIVSAADLLDKTYAAQRRQLICDNALPETSSGLPKGGTVYLAAADQDFMVSFIQSNYAGFGSGILIPGTGIALQNRASGFSTSRGDNEAREQTGSRKWH